MKPANAGERRDLAGACLQPFPGNLYQRHAARAPSSSTLVTSLSTGTSQSVPTIELTIHTVGPRSRRHHRAGNVVQRVVDERRFTAPPHSWSRSNTITAVKEFPGRAHLITAQDGWQEVADDALDWALANAGRTADESAVEPRS
jgi:hypothetical protein